jgi:3-hydroxymyristoyl/3-hydroxydecanoyl-(acyl carrier protein) dehydratase
MNRPEPAGTVVARFRAGEDHPALPGHFPGRPIVPGVLLLDAVLQALRDAGAGRPARLLRAKFAAAVTPGAEVEITLAPRGEASGRFAFTCRAGGTVVLLGEVACAAPPSPAR